MVIAKLLHRIEGNSSELGSEVDIGVARSINVLNSCLRGTLRLTFRPIQPLPTGEVFRLEL
jgi:hypothetical protein